MPSPRGTRSKQAQERRVKRELSHAFGYRDYAMCETVWIDADKAVVNLNGVIFEGVDVTNYSWLEKGEVLSDSRGRGSQLVRIILQALVDEGSFQT